METIKILPERQQTQRASIVSFYPQDQEIKIRIKPVEETEVNEFFSREVTKTFAETIDNLSVQRREDFIDVMKMIVASAFEVPQEDIITDL